MVQRVRSQSLWMVPHFTDALIMGHMGERHRCQA